MNLHKYFRFLLLVGVSTLTVAATSSRWGKDYFPNSVLVTENGDKVRFFDDLIDGKIVVINFIYTTCPDVCPLETASLVRVQNLLQDRLGKEVFFYSITIDPERDTPPVLKEYKERFGAKWQFLTGHKKDIDRIRKKLGLYIEDIQQEGSNNHNISMIIGNQRTGRWMKKSPFENAHVLADQIGNWLTGWKSPPRGRDYASAPKLRQISDGEKLYRTRCVSCHSIDGSNSSPLGPDLLGVNQRRDRAWLVRWLRDPPKMIKDKDPIAVQMYEEYRKIVMPNMRLSNVDIENLLKYFDQETAYHRKRYKPATYGATSPGLRSQGGGQDVVAVMNAWIPEAHPKATVNAGYMTLVNVGRQDLAVVKVESERFRSVEIHEMAHVDGMMEMKEINRLPIPARKTVELKTGGKHLMLMSPHKPVKVGERIELKLTFDSGRQQKVSLAVKSRDNSGT